MIHIFTSQKYDNNWESIQARMDQGRAHEPSPHISQT